MPKTGSTAIADGLRAAGAGAVHHVHDLDAAHLAEEERDYQWSGRPWRTWDAQHLLRHPPTPQDPWSVVTLVRDPIAQSISAFFQPGARRGYLRSDSRVSDLTARFGDRLQRLPLHWFESHLQPALGIDVYASEFDPARGYQIIRGESIRLLLLRCEDLAVAPHALMELLDLPAPVPVERRNVASEKEYATLYRKFVSALRPSAEQLDAVYHSRLVSHFYADSEIDRFRVLWCTDSAADHDGPATDVDVDR